MILATYDGTQTVSVGAPFAQLGINLDGVTTYTTFQNMGTWNNGNDLDNSIAPLNIGGQVDSGGIHTFNGDLAEVLIFDRLLNGAEIVQLNNYFDVEYVTGSLPAPEPSTLALFSLGLLSLQVVRRKGENG